MKRFAIPYGMGLFILYGALGCDGTSAGVEDCFWIGGLNPLSGDLATLGLSLENSAKLAVQDINAAGKVAGKSLCLAVADTRTNPERAPAIVDGLVARNQIVALNGPAASASTLRAAEAADRHDMALVSCCSTSPILSDNEHVFRTVPSDVLQGVVLAEIAAGMNDIETVAIIYINDSYGNELLDQFRTAYRNHVDQVNLVEVPYDSGADTYAPVVRSAFEQEVDLAVLIAFPLAAAEIIKAWRESRLVSDVRWLATDGLKDDQFVFLLGDNVPELIGTAPASSSDYYAGFDSRYRKAFGGAAPGIFTPNQYDAVMLIALALHQIGPNRTLPEYRQQIRERIRNISQAPGTMVHADDLTTALEEAALGDVDYAGVSGPVDLDRRGDVAAGYRQWSIRPVQGGIQEDDVCYECQLAQTETATIGCNRIACDA